MSSRPTIVTLGWGSLIWDARPDFDEQHDAWRLDGPKLKIEFARVSASRGGALTLVIEPTYGALCQVAYARSKRRDPLDAICDLRSREGTTWSNVGYYHADGSTSQCRDPETLSVIEAWAKTAVVDVVVWTDLASNFTKKVGRQFSVPAAVSRLQGLDAAAKAGAAACVWRAPDFVKTPLRAVLQAHPWFTQ